MVMPTTIPTTRSTRWHRAGTVALWTATVIPALSLGLAGVAKLSTHGEWDRLFVSWGYPIWFMFLIGVVEVLGAAGLFVRRTAWLSAYLLAAVMLGAFATLASHPGTHLLRGRQAPMGSTTPAVMFVLLTIVGTVRWRQRRVQARPRQGASADGSLRRYWFPASQGQGVGVTAPDAGTAWFAAKAAVHRLPPGATVSRRYVEDVGLGTLGLADFEAASKQPGVWFPAGTVRPVHLQAAPTPEIARATFVRVDEDGSAHALTAAEAECLATSFDATDGARPAIKRHYDSRWPSGRLEGFLPRSELPAHIPIQPGASSKT